MPVPTVRYPFSVVVTFLNKESRDLAIKTLATVDREMESLDHLVIRFSFRTLRALTEFCDETKGLAIA